MTMPAISADTISAAQAGDRDAMWHIVTAHEPLFAGVIRQVAPGATADDRDDLLQEARAVLVEKVRLYDTDASAVLSTFVYRAIHHAVLAEWVRMTSGVSVDMSTVLRVRRVMAEYAGNTEAAALSAFARHGMSRGTFLAALDSMQAADCLDAPVGGGHADGEGTLTLADVIADPTQDITDPIERRELAEWLLSKIESRQSYTLRSTYGVGMDKAADDDVAAHLRTSRSSVRKIRERGIASCRTVADRHDIAA